MPSRSGNILIVDDEATSAIVRAVRHRLEDEGWGTKVIGKDEHASADDMLWATMAAIDEHLPDGIILDVRLGEYRDDQFKGLDILKRIVGQHPRLPVLMFTQYSQGVERDTVARSALQVEAPVEFIDKLASPEEVALRVRRLVGAEPTTITIGDRIVVDTEARTVQVRDTDGQLARFPTFPGAALTSWLNWPRRGIAAPATWSPSTGWNGTWWETTPGLRCGSASARSRSQWAARWAPRWGPTISSSACVIGAIVCSPCDNEAIQWQLLHRKAHLRTPGKRCPEWRWPSLAWQ